MPVLPATPVLPRSLMRTSAVVAALLVLAGCGSSGGDGGQSSAGASGDGVHAVDTGLGTVLADDSGHTLYLFTADSGGSSACDQQCLQIWTPVPAGSAGSAITAQVGSTQSTAGDRMLTVAGHPLYTFGQDQASGDVNGQGIESFGGEWYAVAPDGAKVEKDSGGDGGGDSGGGGGGYSKVY